jgi:hypothetical protein
MERVSPSGLTRLDHLLQTPIGVDLHSIQVVEPIDLGRIFTELLRKRIRQVVCGVCRLEASAQGPATGFKVAHYQQDGFSDSRELHSERTRRGRFA